MAFASAERHNSGVSYEGWLYHVGVNSLGYQFCRSRYLVIKGNRVEMYTANPQERPRKVCFGCPTEHLLPFVFRMQIYALILLYLAIISPRI